MPVTHSGTSGKFYFTIATPASGLAQVEEVGNNPGVTGIQLRFAWSEMETSLGDYSAGFAIIDDFLDECAKFDLELVVMIEDRSFKGTDPNPVPGYLDEEGPDPPYSNNTDGSSSFPNGWVGFRWKDYYVERKSLMFEAIAANYSAEPRLAGLCDNESSYGLKSATANANGYTSQGYSDALVEIARRAKVALGTKDFYSYVNFIPQQQSLMIEHWNQGAANGVHMGNPDVLPYKSSLEDAENGGNANNTYAQHRSHRTDPTFSHIQNDSFRYTGGPSGPPVDDNGYGMWNPEEIIRWAIYNISCDVVFVNIWRGNGYNWEQALPAIAYYDGFVPAQDESISEVYIDLSLATTGNEDGTGNNPWNDMADVTIDENTALRFRRGKTHYLPDGEGGIDFDSGADATWFEVTSYGGDTNPAGGGDGTSWEEIGDLTNNPAILDGSNSATAWTVTGTAENYVWDTTGTDDHGVVFEDGVPLQYVVWDTSIATTALARGQYTRAPTLNYFYARCTDGLDPDTHTMRIAKTERNIRFDSGDVLTNFRTHDLILQGSSRACVRMQGVTTGVIDNCIIRYCGGGSNNSGAGVEVAHNCSDITIENNTFLGTMGNGISAQISTDSTTLDDVTFSSNTITDCGNGIDVSNTTTSDTITDVTIKWNTVTGSGTANNAWHSGVSGAGHGIQTAGDVTTCSIRKNNISDCESQGINLGTGLYSDLTVSRNTIFDCNKGIRNNQSTADASQASVQWNEIYDCTTYGIEHDKTATTGVDIYRRNTVNNCGTNIYLNNVDTTEPICDDNIAANGTYGIRVANSALTITPDYSVLYNNSTADISGAVDGSNVFTDPVFVASVDGATNFSLGQDSSARVIGSAYTGWDSEDDRFGTPYVTDDAGCIAGFLSVGGGGTDPGTGEPSASVGAGGRYMFDSTDYRNMRGSAV